jgi:hypothetical protein
MRELAEGQVSPAYSGKYEVLPRPRQKQFPKAMEPSRQLLRPRRRVFSTWGGPRPNPKRHSSDRRIINRRLPPGGYNAITLFGKSTINKGHKAH